VCRQVGWQTVSTDLRFGRHSRAARSQHQEGLDCELSDPVQKADALQRLVEQLEALQSWLEERLPQQLDMPPLQEHLQLLRELQAQDLEPDPNGPKGKQRIRDGVAPERRISITDPEMRHGRKSKSKPFNGYKRHLAADLDSRLVLACAVTPANRP